MLQKKIVREMRRKTYIKLYYFISNLFSAVRKWDYINYILAMVAPFVKRLGVTDV